MSLSWTECDYVLSVLADARRVWILFSRHVTWDWLALRATGDASDHTALVLRRNSGIDSAFAIYILVFASRK